MTVQVRTTQACAYLREIHSTRPIDMVLSEAQEKLPKLNYDEDCFHSILKRGRKEASPEDFEAFKQWSQEKSLLEMDA